MNDDPLVYFITWTTYGTWLPGDVRGWTKRHKGSQLSRIGVASYARSQLMEDPLTLDAAQRCLVDATIRRHCAIRGWYLHTLNVRTNHIHVVVTAAEYDSQVVMDQFKAWCTRRLQALARQRQDDHTTRESWWTEGGSRRNVFTEEDLEAVITYVSECQDAPKERPGRRR